MLGKNSKTENMRVTLERLAPQYLCARLLVEKEMFHTRSYFTLVHHRAYSFP